MFVLVVFFKREKPMRALATCLAFLATLMAPALSAAEPRWIESWGTALPLAPPPPPPDLALRHPLQQLALPQKVITSSPFHSDTRLRFSAMG